MTDPIYFRRGDRIFRVINTAEFMGDRWLICQVANAATGSYDVTTVPVDTMMDDDMVGEGPWLAAEEAARKAKAEAQRRADFLADAERYGVHVKANNGRSGWDVTIVRVTQTRYIDSHGKQWIRDGARHGALVGRGKWDLDRLVENSEVEHRCGGAKSFDFIKAGKAAAKDAK